MGGVLTVPARATHIFALVILLGTLFPADALAYLDPGTGSLFIQSVIAAIAAAGYAVRVYWSRIQLLWKRPDGDPKDEKSPVGRA